MERIDLFENIETLPKEVESVLNKHAECENDYESCANLVKELNAVGYTCEYYLDAEPFGLRKMIKKGNSYTYDEIENLTLDKGLDNSEFSLEELGSFIIGKHFLVLEHGTEDKVASFTLTGTKGDLSIYECVYTDFS